MSFGPVLDKVTRGLRTNNNNNKVNNLAFSKLVKILEQNFRQIYFSNLLSILPSMSTNIVN